MAEVTEAAPYDVVGAMIEFEMGEMGDDATIKLIQHLIDTGMISGLQGSYARLAEFLIEKGYCHPKK
jgi:hypothetical protein